MKTVLVFNLGQFKIISFPHCQKTVFLDLKKLDWTEHVILRWVNKLYESFTPFRISSLRTDSMQSQSSFCFVFQTPLQSLSSDVPPEHCQMKQYILLDSWKRHGCRGIRLIVTGGDRIHSQKDDPVGCGNLTLDLYKKYSN